MCAMPSNGEPERWAVDTSDLLGVSYHVVD
jgi:hypothetical protein